LDTKEEGKTALLSSPFPFAEIRGHFSQTKKLLLSESQKYIIISKKIKIGAPFWHWDGF
jgi:hypothetical protein